MTPGTAQHLNLLQPDDEGERVTWSHQLWLELFAALGLQPNDGESAWIDTPVPVLPDMEDLWRQHQAAGKPRKEFRVPDLPPLPEEETLRHLIQLRGDVVKLVERVLIAGNSPLAARLALENWSAFGEPVYPQEDWLNPWRKEKTHPELNKLRQALHLRMTDEHVHLAQRIEAGDLLGALGGSPLYEIFGQALVLREEYWMPIGQEGEPYRFEMGDLGGGKDERTAEGGLLPVSLPSFQMAGYQVTIAQYRCFVHSGACDDSAWWPDGAGIWWARQNEDERLPWSLRLTDADAHGLAPVECNFWLAQAYALWEQAQRERAGRGKGQRVQLPTEAQWEGAARWPQAPQAREIGRQAAAPGTATRWRFAHTAGVPVQRPALAGLAGDARPEAAAPAVDFADVWPWHFNHDLRFGGTSPVGVFLDSRAQHGGRALHDLAGNLQEWCTSAYLTNGGQNVLGAQVDRLASGGEFRALRGGGFESASAHCRVSYRGADRYIVAPDNVYNDGAFRLVLALQD